MREVRVRAFAKVNLRLEILGKRADGFHELRTVFQTVSLHDGLILRASRKPGIQLHIQGNRALSNEPPERNLVYRAATALAKELKIRAGTEIILRKNIPAGRGLGGGSSDAAAALLGYLRLQRRKLAAPRLMEIAAQLGADVPFFLWGGRALGVGKGDEIYPLPDGPKFSVLVVSPAKIHVPTPDAYRWLRAGSLTKRGAASKLWKFCALCWNQPESGLWNDFERPVFARHPQLGVIKQELLRRGATEASLAGSGSAVFGIFPSPAKARRAAAGFPHDQTFVCESISRDRYLRAVGGA
jgi:4-diphosphocytidyl-2-C-methyl-D-erythritol kinase